MVLSNVEHVGVARIEA